MSKYSKFALTAVTILSLGAGSAMAGNFTSHHEVSAKPYAHKAKKMPAEEKLALRNYLEYEQREPCQFYQEIPEGFVRDGCKLKPIAPQPKMVKKMPPKQQHKPMRAYTVLNDYEVNFDFDSTQIEVSANAMLDKAASEIKTYNPREVTVAGYADKAGPSDYNLKLSKKRAKAVSEALTKRGVENRVLDEEAYGETHAAIDTKDGVPLRENRRVMIEFRK